MKNKTKLYQIDMIGFRGLTLMDCGTGEEIPYNEDAPLFSHVSTVLAEQERKRQITIMEVLR
jgi:hypothetical protein